MLSGPPKKKKMSQHRGNGNNRSDQVYRELFTSRNASWAQRFAPLQRRQGLRSLEQIMQVRPINNDFVQTLVDWMLNDSQEVHQRYAESIAIAERAVNRIESLRSKAAKVDQSSSALSVARSCERQLLETNRQLQSRAEQAESQLAVVNEQLLRARQDAEFWRSMVENCQPTLQQELLRVQGELEALRQQKLST